MQNLTFLGKHRPLTVPRVTSEFDPRGKPHRSSLSEGQVVTLKLT
jgi:hypothetical protein